MFEIDTSLTEGSSVQYNETISNDFNFILLYYCDNTIEKNIQQSMIIPSELFHEGTTIFMSEANDSSYDMTVALQLYRDRVVVKQLTGSDTNNRIYAYIF